MDKWIDVKQTPEFGGEYNVVWELHDGLHPTVTTMDYDAVNKKWIDMQTNSDETENVLYYQELPELPEHLKPKNNV